jgi:hypothetical protein
MLIVMLAFWIVIFPSKISFLMVLDETIDYVYALAIPHAVLALIVLMSYIMASGRNPGRLRPDG